MRLRRFVREGRHVIPLLVVILITSLGLFVADAVTGPHHIVVQDGWPPKVWLERRP